MFFLNKLWLQLFFRMFFLRKNTLKLNEVYFLFVSEFEFWMCEATRLNDGHPQKPQLNGWGKTRWYNLKETSLKFDYFNFFQKFWLSCFDIIYYYHPITFTKTSFQLQNVQITNRDLNKINHFGHLNYFVQIICGNT